MYLQFAQSSFFPWEDFDFHIFQLPHVDYSIDVKSNETMEQEYLFLSWETQQLD